MTDFEAHRPELIGYCYRMLGGAFEAEDAVQETLVKAWRGDYDSAKGSPRAWLYRIATNVCVDMLRSAQRRAMAMEVVDPGGPLGEPLPPSAWVQPIPDRLLDPADTVVARESIRLAFVAALQHLAPRQRAVLILRDVLCWQADEVAALLETTVAGVNSALQRARATLKAPKPLRDPADHDLAKRYVDAFLRYDVDMLVSMLHEDATMSMPPFAWWMRGRDNIRIALLSPDAVCQGAQAVITRANGCFAFGQYLEGKPFGLVVLETDGGVVTGDTTYLDPSLFPLFELPMSLDVSSRTTG